ncbi:ATP-binding protein [Legionella worsleiensis]|uniref:ATP-binding protein n=1 Tax=Legionella worsleiensis TaxID=45076 RepID=UPI000E0FF0A2
MSQTKLFNELQAAKASGRFDKKFSDLVKIPLLIVDDFGLRPYVINKMKTSMISFLSVKNVHPPLSQVISSLVNGALLSPIAYLCVFRRT